MTDLTSIARGRVNEIAPGVWYVPAMMANVYFVGPPRGPWVMVDAGVRGTAWRIRAGAEYVYGNIRPEAIVLTHGHFDHVGALEELADEWDVPVFAHPLEMPFLDGRDNYPPPDPTVGGFMAQLSRAFPRKGINIAPRLRPFLIDNSIPFMPGWRTVHTPGHSPGHVSLFRDEDRVLLAGDAVITIDQQNPVKLFAQVRQLFPPPKCFTMDWKQARYSVEALASLRPEVIATGHGLPMSGPDTPRALDELAAHFRPPEHGRYVTEPALADEQGYYYVPPKPYDPVPMYAAGVAIAAAGLIALGMRAKKKSGELEYSRNTPAHLLRPGD